MATIKKGTYRFKAVLLPFETTAITVALPFYVKGAILDDGTLDPNGITNCYGIKFTGKRLDYYLNAEFNSLRTPYDTEMYFWGGMFFYLALGGVTNENVLGWGQVITIPEDGEVSDGVDEWFYKFTEPVTESNATAKISYNGNEIASIESGNTATLPCKGKVMTGDIAVAVSGGSGCGGNHIIEVDTLPTENFNKTDIYMIKVTPACVDFADEEYSSYRAVYDAFGMFFDVYNVDELPTTKIRVSIHNAQVYLYYVKSTNTLYQYKDGSWISLNDKGYTPIMGSIDEYYKYTIELIDVIMDTGTKISLVERYRNQGANIELFGVDKYENVADPHPSNLETGAISLYYDESRDNVYVYSDGLWSSISYTVGAGCGGSITKLGDPTVQGHYYPLVEKGWKRAEWIQI